MSVRIDKNSPSPLGQPPAAPPEPPAHDTMRRLQIGIAGVLTVLLLVGMAGLIGDRAREQVERADAVSSEIKTPGTDKAGGAPLEELGVQPVSPSSKDENADTSVKVPQAVAPAATVPDLEPDPELERARQSAP
ncbi:hypothetical protein [Sphingopyxis kveilinensis]|uniref:hypothetical protein n=1 Tax=Sphingopyxis kveilinensis TaxID=3114367 RepID=UPI0030D4CAEB